MAKDPALLNKRFLKHIERKWLMNNHDLNEISCVYVIVAYDFYGKNNHRIVYVGSTTNIRLRYKSHKIPQLIQNSGYVNLMYYLPMIRGFYDYEIKLISNLKPVYNKQHKNGKTIHRHKQI